MKNFAIIGLGYIAPRHLRAIKDVGGNLICAYDPRDSVGILDSYFPQADFFTEFERFDRFINKKGQDKIDYLVICSPNYLHDSHCRYGLRNGMNVICEKPLVLNPWNAEALMEMEKETGKKVNTILQLRLHPSIIDLKKRVDETFERFDVNLTYVTPRGKWYSSSWKGDENKSGGIATNIGIHFFDMLQWVFGSLSTSINHKDEGSISGCSVTNKAKIDWDLSISGDTAIRTLELGGEIIDFTTGFDNLHGLSYEEILAGRGFTISEAMQSIKIVSEIRNSNINKAALI